MRISAASSLTDVMDEISQKFEKEKGISIALTFASSSILARQIANGLKTDLFLSADPLWLQYLIKQNCIDSSHVQKIFSNTLIIVTTIDSEIKISSVDDLLQQQIHTIAVGDPSHVPAGRYAQEALENAGVWDRVKMKLVGAIDVRAALAFVENKSVDCAIVYSSDIYTKEDVKLVYEIPEMLLPDIIYMIGIIKNGNRDLAEKFTAFLEDSVHEHIFIKHGFKPL
jgi:molybdate transport system substrate-binding protein